MQPRASFMRLLLDNADAESIRRLRKTLLGEAVPADHGAIEDEARRAEQLRTQLAEHRLHAMELTSLHDLSLRLSGVLQLNALLQDTVTYARSLLGVDIAYLALVEPDMTVTIRVTDGSMGHRLRGVVMPPGSGLAGQVVAHAEPIQTQDYLADTGITHNSATDQVAVSESMRSVLGAPLRLRGDVIGVLMVAQRERRVFSPSEVSLLSSLAAVAAVAIDNARLIEGYRDAATELALANEQLTRNVETSNRAAALHETLLDVASRGGGIEDIVGRLSSMFEGSIAYVDADDRLVNAARNGRLTPDVVVMKIEGVLPSVLFAGTGQRRTHLHEPVISVPVATGLAYFGVLQLHLDEPLRDLDVRMLERAAMTIALVASSERAVADAEHHSAVELLEQLLTRRVDDEPTFARRARPLGLNLEAAHAVAVIDPLPGDASRILPQVRDLLARCGGLAERVLGAVVVLARCDEATLRAGLAPVLARGTTGVAGPALGALPLAAAYDEARACAAALTALDRTGDVASAAELGPYRFLLSRAGQADALQFVRITVGPLLAHDAERGTALARTADVFLSGGRHHAWAAAELQIHANTLYQRLDRIAERLGEDWRERDRALDVQLALRLSRLIGKVDPPTP